jgi:ABC-2 type transport system permease protein
LDVTKLQSYPLTRAEQMVSLVLATFFDISTLFIVALYVAIFLGWHATPAAGAVTFVALVIAYLNTVGFSQLVLAALMGILRSRRYRDLAVIVFAIAASFWSLGSQFLFGRVFRHLSFKHPESLGAIHVDKYLQWSPPGMATRAITLADSGHIAQALPWLLVSGALVPVVLSLWARILERGITTAETAGTGGASKPTRRRRLATASDTALAPVRRRGRHFSGPTWAIAWKDALYVWRDPQLKAALLSSLLATAFLFVPNLFSASETGLNGRQAVVIAPVPALLVIMVLSINALGLERQGLQTLFMFPVRPLDILFGKNLFAGALAFMLEIILVVLKAALTNGWENIPIALSLGLAAIFVMMACGNVTSVVAPFRTRTVRMGDTSSFNSENGCLRSLISIFALGVMLILVLPIIAALTVPIAIGHRPWIVVTLPGAILYGALLHQAATRMIAPTLLRRAPEILAITVQET